MSKLFKLATFLTEEETLEYLGQLIGEKVDKFYFNRLTKYGYITKYVGMPATYKEVKIKGKKILSIADKESFKSLYFPILPIGTNPCVNVINGETYVHLFKSKDGKYYTAFDYKGDIVRSFNYLSHSVPSYRDPSFSYFRDDVIQAADILNNDEVGTMDILTTLPPKPVYCYHFEKKPDEPEEQEIETIIYLTDLNYKPTKKNNYSNYNTHMCLISALTKFIEARTSKKQNFIAKVLDQEYSSKIKGLGVDNIKNIFADANKILKDNL